MNIVCIHHCGFIILCKLWYTWHLHLVVNEVIRLIIGSDPKACHMELCKKLI